jgi:polysaccharide export outer membrane protein
MKTFVYISMLCVIGTSLVAQEAASDSSATESTSSATTASASTGTGNIPSALYVIRPSDVLEVHVFREPDLNTRAKVDAEGKINLPLIGNVEVAGKTVRDAQKLIHDLLADGFLVNPHVTIVMQYYAERRVTVNGYVHSQGEIMFPPEEEMTLTQAIARARGLTQMASGIVTIKRTEDDGKTSTFEVNYHRIVGRSGTVDPQLKKGDILTVEKRIF